MLATLGCWTRFAQPVNTVNADQNLTACSSQLVEKISCENKSANTRHFAEYFSLFRLQKRTAKSRQKLFFWKVGNTISSLNTPQPLKISAM
jgi:hypothetical protein